MKILLSLTLFFHSLMLFAQIENPAYDLMLKGLLSNSISKISVNEANQLIDSVVFFDTRSQKEYEISHIKNARWIGYEDFDLKKVKNLPKDSRVIVYCSVGYRSEKVGEKLKQAGYTNISNLYGGIFEWVNQEFDVYNEEGKTDEIHPYDKFWSIWLNKGKKVYE